MQTKGAHETRARRNGLIAELIPQLDAGWSPASARLGAGRGRTLAHVTSSVRAHRWASCVARHDGGVDYSLVIAAAQAAGPCPPGEEAVWGRRVHLLAVDLHKIAQQAAEDIEQLESAHRFVAFLEKFEIEESSRRGVLTLRLPNGEFDPPVRTEQQETDRGKQMIERARSLVGRWVLVYRYNESMASNKRHNVRMLAHLMDLGDGAISGDVAKKIVVQDAGGDVERAKEAWESAGLPATGPVSVAWLEKARAELQG